MKRIVEILQDIAIFVIGRLAIAALWVIGIFDGNADDPYE